MNKGPTVCVQVEIMAELKRMDAAGCEMADVSIILQGRYLSF